MGIYNALDEPADDAAHDGLPPVNSYVRLIGEMRIYHDSERRGPCEVVPDGSYGRVAYHLHEEDEAVGVRWFRRPIGMDEGCAILTTAEVNVNAVRPVSDLEFEEWLRPWRPFEGWRTLAVVGLAALVLVVIALRIITG